MIPSLVWICSRVLARYADQLPVDILRNYDSKRSDLLCGALDPPLCATLVQLYDNLPQQLHSLTLPLAHPHIPLLQAIPNTSLFSLITILDLPACPHLTDSSIIHLSALHSLVALDASATALSSYGIKVLAETLLWISEEPAVDRHKIS
ncbi:hypothetical protein H0H92_002675 [Tricholoma furcatifolium]|nr:hypothetical protein H0H92_002675 [Tricholoma furcatifolium]